MKKPNFSNLSYDSLKVLIDSYTDVSKLRHHQLREYSMLIERLLEIRREEINIKQD